MIPEWTILRNDVIKEQVYYGEVPHGLKLYVLPKKGYQKSYAVLATRFGSIDRQFRIKEQDESVEVPDGVAHFLEHKLFEDAQGDVFHRFAALGAQANAFTSFTQTAYLFSSTQNFTDNLELLLNFVQDPYFTEESVLKEQGIIGQEIRMYEDNPQWRLFFNLLGALYREHPVKIDIAGTVESIGRITPEILYRCYRTFYHPENMALFVVGGGVDPDEIGRQVANNYLARDYRPLGEIRRYYPHEPSEINRRRVAQAMVVAEPLINIGFKDESPESLPAREALKREIVNDLVMDIIFAESEPLYNELYEEGLINEQFEAGYVMEKNYAYTIISGETRDPELLYERIMEGIEKIKAEGFGREQVERHMRSKLGGFMRRFNSLEYIANNFLAYRFRGLDFFAYPELLKEVTAEEANRCLCEQLHADNHAVSIIEKI
ncbi:MAG: pitrilysin family protein [Dethiobacteria bacterium]